MFLPLLCVIPLDCYAPCAEKFLGRADFFAPFGHDFAPDKNMFAPKPNDL